MIDFLANSIGRWQLKRKFLEKNRVAEALNLNEIKSAIIICEVLSKEWYEKVLSLVDTLQKEGIASIELVGSAMVKEVPEYVDTNRINILTGKDVSKLGIPSVSFTKQFIDKPYDLLLDCTVNNQVPTDYLLAMIDAKSKVGVAGDANEYIFDLLIEGSKESEFESYGKNVIHFLKMINRK